MQTLNFFTKFLSRFADTGRELGIKVLGSFAIIVLGWIVAGVVRKIMSKALKNAKLDTSFKKFLVKAIDIVLKTFVILSAVSNMGISTTGLIAALSAAAVAISLALKDSLGNIAGGILMMVTRPFSTGDFITVDGESGTVLKIDLIHTVLQTPDNRQVVIPNGQLVNKTVTDYSREEMRRVDIDFAISYNSDVEVAKAVIMDVIGNCEVALTDPAPFVRVTDYGDSSVTVTARVWCKTGDYWDVKLGLLEDVRTLFIANGIEIPYNQLDVHVDGKLDK